jgi:hypothetical protein
MQCVSLWQYGGSWRMKAKENISPRRHNTCILPWRLSNLPPQLLSCCVDLVTFRGSLYILPWRFSNLQLQLILRLQREVKKKYMSLIRFRKIENISYNYLFDMFIGFSSMNQRKRNFTNQYKTRYMYAKVFRKWMEIDKETLVNKPTMQNEPVILIFRKQLDRSFQLCP